MTATIDTRAPERAETDAEIIGAALAATPKVTTTTITVPSVDELQRVLTNALLAASTEHTRPILCAVQVEITDGVVEIVTTDSYRMMHQAPAWETAGPDGRWLIDREHLAPVLALCKLIKGRDRDLPVAARFGPSATGRAMGEVRFTSARLDTGARLLDADFPNWRQLVPDDETLTGAGLAGIAFNPRQIADLTKYRAPDRKAGEHTIKLRTQDHLKPAMFTLSAEAWYLLMPVRTS